MQKKCNKTISALAVAAAVLSSALFAGNGLSDGGTPDSFSSVHIGVEESVDSLNIFERTENSPAADWVFTMIYDRLLEQDNNGNIQPALALSWQLLSRPDPNGGSFTPLDVIWPEFCGDKWSGISEWEAASHEHDVEWWGDVLDDDSEISPDEYNFFTGSGWLGLELTLRSDVVFTNGEPFDAYMLRNFILAAKLQPSNTLIYRQWEAVNSVVIVDEYTVQLWFVFSDKPYGYCDFFYSLTSPLASIVFPDDEAEIMVGSGAFCVDSDMGTSGVILSRNADWWKGTAPSDEVVFTWNVNNVTGETSEEYNVYVFNDAACYDDIADENSPLYGADTITVAENPVLLSFNLSDDSGSVFENEDYRKFFAAQLNFSGIRQNFEELLAFESHDYWLTVLQYYSNLTLDDLSYIGVDYDNLELKFLLPVDSRFRQIVEVMQAQLAAKGIIIQINIKSQDLYDQDIEDGDYDITLVEVDLSRINSNYQTLYSQINTNANNMILMSQRSVDVPTYKSTQNDIQEEMLNHAAKINLGWTKKVIVYDKFSVDGISAPGGFHPMGDSNRIDFRWVSLSQD